LDFEDILQGDEPCRLHSVMGRPQGVGVVVDFLRGYGSILVFKAV
jgi:hypothetical protein